HHWALVPVLASDNFQLVPIDCCRATTPPVNAEFLSPLVLAPMHLVMSGVLLHACLVIAGSLLGGIRPQYGFRQCASVLPVIFRPNLYHPTRCEIELASTNNALAQIRRAWWY